jgi:hypothetical protein
VGFGQCVEETTSVISTLKQYDYDCIDNAADAALTWLMGPLPPWFIIFIIYFSLLDASSIILGDLHANKTWSVPLTAMYDLPPVVHALPPASPLAVLSMCCFAVFKTPWVSIRLLTWWVSGPTLVSGE